MTDKNKQKYTEIYAMMEKGEFESAYVALSKLENKNKVNTKDFLKAIAERI